MFQQGVFSIAWKSQAGVPNVLKSPFEGWVQAKDGLLLVWTRAWVADVAGPDYKCAQYIVPADAINLVEITSPVWS